MKLTNNSTRLTHLVAKQCTVNWKRITNDDRTHTRAATEPIPSSIWHRMLKVSGSSASVGWGQWTNAMANGFYDVVRRKRAFHLCYIVLDCLWPIALCQSLVMVCSYKYVVKAMHVGLLQAIMRGIESCAYSHNVMTPNIVTIMYLLLVSVSFSAFVADK